MKLIIAGGRDFNNPKLMMAELVKLAVNRDIDTNSELVCGMARGADIISYRLWDEIYHLPIHKFTVDWGMHGKSAGFIRNSEMAQFADVLVAFWDGKSHGTRHMIKTMEKLGKPVFVIKY